MKQVKKAACAATDYDVLNRYRAGMLAFQPGNRSAPKYPTATSDIHFALQHFTTASSSCNLTFSRLMVLSLTMSGPACTAQATKNEELWDGRSHRQEASCNTNALLLLYTREKRYYTRGIVRKANAFSRRCQPNAAFHPAGHGSILSSRVGGVSTSGRARLRSTQASVSHPSLEAEEGCVSSSRLGSKLHPLISGCRRRKHGQQAKSRSTRLHTLISGSA